MSGDRAAGEGIHPRLASDSVPVGRLDLCRVLLMDDRTVPWLILVPSVPGPGWALELHHLTFPSRGLLIEEVTMTSRALSELYRPDKVNVGALGNEVPQLHLHVVARFENDRAWPGPVWGAAGGERYREDEREREVARLRRALGMR